MNLLRISEIKHLEPWLIFLIILAIAVLIIIITSARRKKQKKKPQQQIQTFVNFGDFVSAGAMHLRQNREKEAADLYSKHLLRNVPLLKLW